MAAPMASLIMRGLLAARPAPTVYNAGVLYHATDTGLIYRVADDGSAWQQYGPGGGALTVEEADGSPSDGAVTKLVFPNGTLAIAAHVATYTPAGGGGGGGGATPALDYNETADRTPSGGTAYAANTWVNILAQQTFALSGGLATIHPIGCVLIDTNAPGVITSRVLIDGTIERKCGWLRLGGMGIDLLHFATVALSGLAAGSHTIDWQFRNSAAGGNWYLPAASLPDYHARLQVIEA